MKMDSGGIIRKFIVKWKRDQIWSEMFEVVFDRRIVQYLTENHPGYRDLLKNEAICLEIMI